MRPYRFIPSLCLLACLWLATPTPAHAQPMSERVPDDAKVYIGWSGVDHMGPGFSGSNFEGFLKAVDMPRLAQQVMDTIRAFAAMEGGGDPEADAALSLASEVVSAIWHNPTAFYFADVDMTDPNMPIPRMALICKMGDEAAALRQRVIEVGGAPPPEILFEARDGMLVLASGMTLDEALKPAKPLAANPRFKEAMGIVQTGKTPAAFAAYCDMPAILKMADAIATQEAPTPEDLAQYKKVTEALGLNGLGRVVLSGSFDGKDWISAAFVEAPAPRKGLLKILETAPVNRESFNLIPATAEWASVTRFDLAAAYDTVMIIVAELSPESMPQFSQGLAQANAELGFDIVNDFIRATGTDWAFYSDASLGGGMGMSFALVSPLRDAARFDASLTALENKVQPMLAGAMAETPLGMMQITRSTYAGVTTRSINLALYAVSWSVHEGNFYLSLFPQNVVAAVQNTKSTGPKLIDDPKLKALLQRIGEKPWHSIAYSDLARTMPQMYQAAMMGTQMLQALSMQQGVAIQPLILPPINDLKPYFTETAAVNWADAKGIHFRSLSPFPGSEIFSPGSMMSSFAAGGVLAALVIPQFSNAGEEARANSLIAQLQSLRSQLELFQVQHNGEYPDLGSGSDSDWGVLTSPSGTNHTGPGADPAPPARNTRGPYLRQPPMNAFEKSATVAFTPGPGIGWVYDRVTGELYAVVSAAKATQLGLDDSNDVRTYE